MNGYTALHIAALHGNQALVRMLLEAGAEVNPRDKLHEDTPLHKAVIEGHVAAIRVLLQQGADVRSTNLIRRTPAQHTRACGHDEAAQRIDEYAVDIHS